MVKHLKYPLLFIISIIGLYLFLTPHKIEQNVNEEAHETVLPQFQKVQTKIKSEKILKNPETPKAQSPDTKGPPESSKNLKPKELLTAKQAEENLIRYEVKNGYVIASGDILIGRIDPNKTSIPRSGTYQLTNRVETWPNGVVPFAIDKNVSGELIRRIQKAMEEFHTKTAIRFVDYNNERDAVLFDYEKGLCASHVGRIGGHQQILLSDECGVTEIIHELMHTLGFIHEQQRQNRDRYIEIFEDNIIEDKLLNFDIMPADYQRIYKNLSSVFDYKSVTIYPENAFAKKTEDKTIQSKDNTKTIAPSEKLSPEDLKKIEEIYVRQF